jgi:hypothetical protein
MLGAGVATPGTTLTLRRSLLRRLQLTHVGTGSTHSFERLLLAPPKQGDDCGTGARRAGWSAGAEGRLFVFLKHFG